MYPRQAAWRRNAGRRRGGWLALGGLSLALAGCGGAAKTTPADGSTVKRDGGFLPGSDSALPGKIGTNCKPVGTVAIHTSTNGKAPWMPRLAWANDQYGLTFAQETVVSSTVKTNPMFLRLSKDGKAQGEPVALTKDPSARMMEGVAIANSGKDFVVVWGDNREASDKSDLYFLSLSENGERLAAGAVCKDPGCGEVKVTTSTKAGYPYLLRPGFVEAGGANQLALTWRDSRNSKTTPYPPYESGRSDVYFKVIKADGAELVPEKRITTDTSKKAPFSPELAFDGKQYAMVWRDFPTGGSNEHFFLLLGQDGTPVGTEKSLSKSYGLLDSTPDLVYAGAEFGIAFSENPSKDKGMVQFSRITKTGDLLAAQTVNAAGSPCTPAVSYNGERYAVVWQDNCGKEGSKLVFAILDDAGKPMKADGKSCVSDPDERCGLVTLSPDEKGTASFPEVISVGGAYAVAWMNAPQKQILFTHVVCSAQ
ncbi:MAG: hypothetical protein IT371_10830 [Deltaproteobacteria bacterium]|nr:hypothetical protein [Deltaproteobacteria bacterium]